MGQILDCNCENCGYRKKELLLGNGENREYYYFPAFDSKRKTEVQIDISALVEEFDQKDSIINIDGLNELKEKGKIPYFVKGMYKRTKLIGEPISSASLYLQSQYNLCPKCSEFSLTFQFVGLFD